MVPRPDFYRFVRNGLIDSVRGEIETFTESGITLDDDSKLRVDVVILATGWRTDYSFLGEKQLNKLNIEQDGFYLYRHMINPDIPNMVFLGCNAITYEAITTYNLQARWLAELLKGRHRLPERAEMTKNIEDMKRWKRSWMVPGPGRGAMIGPHQLHYHDELLRDFGADPKRKKGFFRAADGVDRTVRGPRLREHRIGHVGTGRDSIRLIQGRGGKLTGYAPCPCCAAANPPLRHRGHRRGVSEATN